MSRPAILRGIAGAGAGLARYRLVRTVATEVAGLLTWSGGWMMHGAIAIKRWIERHGGPGGCT